MNKLKLIAGVILIFVVGAFAGSFGTGLYFQQEIKGYGRPEPSSPNNRTALIMKKLSSKLDLTESQNSEIGRIVEESETKIMAVRRQYLPEIKKILDETFETINGKLTSEQQERFDKIKQKIESRHAKAFINSVLVRQKPVLILSNLKDRLNLSDEQLKKIRPIIEKNYEGLNRIVKKYRGKDRPEMFSIKGDLRELQMGTEKELANILSRDQLEAYVNMQREELFERRR